MRYQGTIIRPFSEADSYLLQCTLGCSHNQCTFCGTYKDKPFRIRPLREIFELLDPFETLAEMRTPPIICRSTARCSGIKPGCLPWWMK